MQKLAFLTGWRKHQILPRFQSKLHLNSSLGFWARKELLLRKLRPAMALPRAEPALEFQTERGKDTNNYGGGMIYK